MCMPVFAAKSNCVLPADLPCFANASIIHGLYTIALRLPAKLTGEEAGDKNSAHYVVIGCTPARCHIVQACPVQPADRQPQALAACVRPSQCRDHPLPGSSGQTGDSVVRILHIRLTSQHYARPWSHPKLPAGSQMHVWKNKEAAELRRVSRQEVSVLSLWGMVCVALLPWRGT